MSDTAVIEPATTAASPVSVSPSIAAELDALFNEPAPAPAPPSPPPAQNAPTKPVEPSPKPPEPTSKKADDDFSDLDLTEASPGAKKEAAPPTPAPAEEDPKTPKELRERFYAVKSEKAAIEAELKEIKSRPPTRVKVEDLPEYKAALAEKRAIEEKYAETRRELEFHDVTTSDEFVAKHWEPVPKSIKTAMDELEMVQVITDAETDAKRAVTREDILELSRLPAIQRIKRVRELFSPDEATFVNEKIRAVSDARANWDRALSEAKQNSGKILEERKQQQAAQAQKMVEAFDGHLQQIRDSAAELYGFLPDTDPDAKDYNAKLMTGKRLIDVAWKGAGQMPVEKRVQAQAIVAARSEAYAPLMHRNAKLEAEVKSLREKLATLEPKAPPIGSEGSPDDATSGGSSPGPKSWEDDLKDFFGKK